MMACRIRLRFRLLLAPALLFAACASPVAHELGKPGASNGPEVELGVFVDPTSSVDLAKMPSVPDLAAAADLAKPSAPSDLAIPSHDLSMPHDMAMTGGCGTITADGICMGDTLIYCDAGSLVTYDCWAQAFSGCEVIGGVADCYF
jgi:hypothetical protein